MRDREDPVRLAAYVLDHQEGWDEEKVRRAMEPADSGQAFAPVTVDLERPIPVYLLYLTAFVRDGVLHFRDDPYQKDRRAMAGQGRPAPPDRSECQELEKLGS